MNLVGIYLENFKFQHWPHCIFCRCCAL